MFQTCARENVQARKPQLSDYFILFGTIVDDIYWLSDGINFHIAPLFVLMWTNDWSDSNLAQKDTVDVILMYRLHLHWIKEIMKREVLPMTPNWSYNFSTTFPTCIFVFRVVVVVFVWLIVYLFVMVFLVFNNGFKLYWKKSQLAQQPTNIRVVSDCQLWY